MLLQICLQFHSSILSELVKQEFATASNKSNKMKIATNTAPLAKAAGHDEIEAEFVYQLLMTGDEEKARIKSGIDIPKMEILLKSSTYDALLEAQVSRIFGKRLIPSALARLSEYIQPGQTPDRGQLDAVKTVLDRAGMVAPKASEPEKHNLEMSEWPVEKLEEFIGIANTELVAKRAPNAQPLNHQVIDVLD